MHLFLLSLIPVTFGTLSENEKVLSEMKEFEASVDRQISSWDNHSVEAHDCLARLQELISAQEHVVSLTKELDELLKTQSPISFEEDHLSIEKIGEREYINVLTVDLELALSASATASDRYKQSLISFQKSLGSITM